MSVSNSANTIEQGFLAGLRPAFDVFTIKAELKTAQATLVQRKRVAQEQVRRLSLLLGRANTLSPEIPEHFPAISLPLPTTLYTDQLLARADIMAAELLLQQQHQRHAIATANRLPRLTLSGNTGYTSEDLSSLANRDISTWRFLGGLTAPLFQGKQLLAEQQRQAALLKAEIATYQQVALAAFSEVEQRLADYRFLAEQQRLELELVGLARAAEIQSQERYLSGLADVTVWLQAQRSAFERQSRLLQTQSAVLKNRIGLYLALGGQFKVEPPHE